MTTTTTGAYAQAASIYWELGWRGIIPVNPKDKGGVPAGFTGRDGIDVTRENLDWFIKSKPNHNLGLRLPDTMVGIDVDAHSGKTGAETIAEAEKRWGRLPYSPRSTSRHHDGDTVSGIRPYRIPTGVKLRDRIKFPELGLEDIEIIQRHHRHIQSWPSRHPGTGHQYEWLGIDGGPLDAPPAPDDIPDLPAAWVEALTQPESSTGSTELGPDGPYSVREALTAGEPSRRVAIKLGQAVAACAGGSRHDNIRDHVLGLLRCGKQGEPGVLVALQQLQKVFVAAVTPDRRDGAEEATDEFNKFVFSDRAAGLLADPSYDDPDNVTEVGTDYFGTDADDGGGDGSDPLENAIRHKLQSLRINREAQRRLDEENNPPAELPPVTPLGALLGEPDSTTPYRIAEVMPSGGRTMAVAQFKAGKTTLVGNSMRSLADGTPFLGAFDVHQPAQRIVLIDDELSRDQLRRWLRDQDIDNTAAVADVIPLRGKVATLNLIDDRTRARWATRLADVGCDYLILDCLRPVLDALALDENRDAGKFLTAFDALLADAGIGDALLVQHMGHANERARGDSRLLDWPDVSWRLVRETEEPDSDRYFSAYGRDVNVAEGKLTYDPATRRLSYSRASRDDARCNAARVAVITLLVDAAAKGAKPNGSAIERDLPGGHSQKAIRQALAQLVRAGLVAVEPGAHNSRLYSIAHPCKECRLPVVSGRERHESCPTDAEELTFP